MDDAGGALLEGLRVVEVSSFVAAPLGGMTLAQLGAEVIRVDPEGGGPDIGRWPVADSGTSLYWTGLNKGKRSMTADFRSPEGRRRGADLITAGCGVRGAGSCSPTRSGGTSLTTRSCGPAGPI